MDKRLYTTLEAMSTTAVATRGVRSTLNPNAPLFIPAAIQKVEDFSPEWWELVKTSTWFRDYWFRQHQEQESFEGDEEEDVANLLPDSVDLDIAEEFSSFESTMGEIAYNGTMSVQQKYYVPVQEKEKQAAGLDAATVIKSLSLKSPRNGSFEPAVEPELSQLSA